MAEDVTIRIYTISGRLIKTIENCPAHTDFNRISWDGKDQDSDPIANGVYIYRIIAKIDDHISGEVNKLVIMK